MEPRHEPIVWSLLNIANDRLKSRNIPLLSPRSSGPRV